MKQFLKKIPGRNLYLLLAAIGLFIIAFLLNKYFLGTTSTRYFTRHIQNRIHEKERDFRQLVKDTALMGSLMDQEYSTATLKKLLDHEKGYEFFICEYEDSGSVADILFWNTQVSVPDTVLPSGDDSSRIVRLSNGLYVQTGTTLHFRPGRNLKAIALIPVLWKYIVENENLKKEFVGYEKAIRQVDISNTVTNHPVKSMSGNVLFYLQPTSANTKQTSTFSLVLVIIGFFLIFMYVHQTAHSVSEKYGLWSGVLFLTVLILLFRTASYLLPDILDLRQFELFDPSIYGSSYVLSSLGDLLINTLLLCWIIIFINRRINISAIKVYRQAWKNRLMLILSVTGLVFSTFTFADILQSMVADAKISFNVINFFSLTQYSFIGFVILATLALSYFFLSQVLLTIARTMTGRNSYLIFILTAAAGLLIISLSSNINMIELNIYTLIWLLVFIWLMQQRIFSGLNFRLNVSEVLFWLFVFSFSMSAVIIFENRKIEYEQRKRFAEKLALQADPASERLLSVTLTYLDSSFLTQNFKRFRNPQSNKFIKDSIINKSIYAYLTKYDTRIYTFDSSGRPLFNEDDASYDTLNTIFRVQGKKTAISGLRYFERSFDKFSYIFRKEVFKADSMKVGALFVLSDPKRHKSDALTPELFKQTGVMVPEYSSIYSYAIYDSANLIINYNDYAFPTQLTMDQMPATEYVNRKNNSFEELWYRPSQDKIVIIARKNNSFIEGITLFAYLFSTFLFLLAFYRFASLLIKSRLRWADFRQYWQLNIRSQIHSTIIMVSLLSFIIIGIATILFFINRYQRNNQDRLTRAIQIMVSQVQTDLEKRKADINDSTTVYPSIFDDESQTLIQEISEIHGMDVNLYDTFGNLAITSSTDLDIYSTGVLSKLMNPMAYHLLYNNRQIQTVTNEKVGKVDYLSIYAPVRNNKGKAVAFVNIPSYSSQGELKQEISNFLVTVINLNAFIFLVAGAIALFITNRITSSFTLIGKKMREINLSEVNEAIEWKRDDEIGGLVKEYNKMVEKLDESAIALAKSEREGAWRQMARQVAHEIKNPLTPMTLSIQYLQKAIDNNSPEVKNMTTNVARTLIEQIDHLSKIASDFSQFANIGNPKNEVFDLHELLYSLSALYEATENLDFQWNQVENRVLLFADKTQLNRLFTNLLQNAIEASAHRDLRIIRMDEELNGEYVTVSITDNGEGIPGHTQSMIYTPNFTTKSSGTGLGLAMSKGIIEQAKGEMWFVTEEGKGTTFFVKLPLLRATV